MNKEIKEILKRFKKVNVNSLCPFEMEASDCKKILNYITNLQQENEYLKQENKKVNGSSSDFWKEG